MGVLFRKWQYKDSLQDAEYVIQRSKDSQLKHRVLLLAARAAKAMFEKTELVASMMPLIVVVCRRP